MTLLAIVGTLIVGVIAGVSAGMFGIGGALLSTPLLHELVGLPAWIALATPLPATIPAAIAGSFIYRRGGYLVSGAILPVAIGGIPMTILGAYLVRFVPGIVMMLLTGILLAYSAILFLRKSRTKSDERSDARGAKRETTEGRKGGGLWGGNNPPTGTTWSTLLLIGVAAGFLSGFLAIGGGLVMVPAFIKLVGMTTKQALATSLACITLLAIPGTLTHHLNGFIDWPIALILCAVVVPFSMLGARITSRLRSHVVERAYGILMLTFAVAFVVKKLVDL